MKAGGIRHYQAIQEEARRQAEQCGVRAYGTVLPGHEVQTIVQHAEQGGFDLVEVPWRRDGWSSQENSRQSTRGMSTFNGFKAAKEALATAIGRLCAFFERRVQRQPLIRARDLGDKLAAEQLLRW